MVLPPLATAPGWLSTSLVVASILLALLAVGLMFLRRQQGDGATRQQPYIDPVLIVSAVGIVALAVAAVLTR